jgi:amino acid transporter
VLAILVLLAVLYISYRQTIAAYPGGGGSYTVAKKNLGQRAGLCAAAALLLDYTLNVAVGISAGVGALESAIPVMQNHTLSCCLVVLAIITLVNLRGVRDSGLAWTLPTYAYVGSMLVALAIGVVKTLQAGGHPDPVEAPPPLMAASSTANIWLILRAFASGCTAMTGVEAVSNGVPIFAEPRVKRARHTLALICGILGLLLAGIGYLAHAYKVGARYQWEPDYQSVVSQLLAAISGRGFLYYAAIFGLLGVLTLSANTSFAGFPRLCRLLAEDSYLPSAFTNLGRRLVYTSGIAVLAVASAILLIAFGGITDRLIPLFAVGAFGAFTFSQAGMVVHWRRAGRRWTSPALLINAFGTVTTAIALVVILAAKFTEGAWITAIVICCFIALFYGVHRHYSRLQAEIEPPSQLQTWKVAPLKVVVPIDGWNRVTERALRFALRISDDIVAVHITSQETNQTLIDVWRERIERPARDAALPAPQLEVIHSPYRQLVQPILNFVNEMKERHPDRLIAVVIPELVQPSWWGYIMHNHAAFALRTMLLSHGDERVVIVSTPWYLRVEEDRRSTRGAR